MQSIEQLEQHFLENEKDTVESLFTVQGFSFARRGQNTGIAFVKLKDWERAQGRRTLQRRGDRRPRDGRASMQIKDAMAFAFAPPPVPSSAPPAASTSTCKDNARPRPRGADRGAQPVPRHGGAEQAARRTCARTARTTRRSSTSTSTSQRPARSGLSIADINSTLSTRLGRPATSTTSSTAAASSASTCRPTRRSAWCRRTSSCWYVRNARGRDGAVLRLRHARTGATARRGSSATTACRRWRSTARPAPGVSSGDAMAEVERLVAQLPPGFGLEWTGAVVPGAAGGRADAAAVRALAAGRVPVPRRAVRELVDPDRGAAGGAARHPRRGARPPRCAAWSATSTSRWRC